MSKVRLHSVAVCWFMVKHHESSMHVFTLMDRRLTFTHKLQFLLMSDLSESHRFLMCWRHRICHSYVMTAFSQLPLSADVIRYQQHSVLLCKHPIYCTSQNHTPRASFTHSQICCIKNQQGILNFIWIYLIIILDGKS